MSIIPVIAGQARRFLCRKCEHKFEAELLTGVLLEVAVHHMKTMRCPKCGSSYRHLSFDLAAEREEIAQEAAEREKALLEEANQEEVAEGNASLGRD